MERIIVNTPKKYDVIIGSDIIKEAVSFTRHRGDRVVLLWDEAVSSGNIAELGNELEKSGKEVMAVSVEGGESVKSIRSYENIANILMDFNMTKTDTLVGIGGGTVMDLAGFLAATYKRGMGLIQIPTTLLAAGDASVGGKNSLNLGDTKNALGTYYQPSLVLIETGILKLLSDDIFSEGCAELIKCAFIGSASLVSMLEGRSLLKNKDDDTYLIDVLTRCIRLKAAVVSRDECDENIRKILNFGHTFGHAIEAESGYKIHHGQAVAMGMVLITRVAEKKGIAEGGTLGRLISVLESNGLEWRCPYNVNVLIGHLIKDKKVRGDEISLILPKKAGECFIKAVKMDELRDWFRE